MSLSLDALRARKSTSRPERAETLCLAPHLVAETQELTDELERLEQDEQLDAQPPARLADGPPPPPADSPRFTEIKARLAELLDEMAEHEGVLRLRAVDDGVWRRWVNAHPARDKDEPGHKRDEEVTAGYCNADDLIDTLGDYAATWNGDPLREGDWAEVFVPNLGGGDKKKLARLVVSMHESDMSIPKWRSALSVSLRNESASTSPDASPSRLADSSDGSPQSDTSTTTQTAS